ncbi:glycosyltransferase family 4 protein [Trujillonella humicola]|uniref:glycosyltransferase family 4 protein n=1 Tax=Trujillonella humicola TaxID=3383699 RepID=UPI0039068004
MDAVTAAGALTVVVPAGIDDPARVSGGNRYDRAVCDELRAAGLRVTEVPVAGAWPRPGDAALADLARALDAVPEGALVLVDGLVASAARPVVVPRARRLRLVVLVHMLFGGAPPDGAVPAGDEAAVLTAARAVVTTSGWTRRRVLERYGVPAGRVHVARPGTEPAPPSAPSPEGGRLLCVGTLSPLKGQDLLVAALGRLPDLPWRCRLVGPLDRDPTFAAAVAGQAVTSGIAGRVAMPGTLRRAALRREYADADLLVVPSRADTYGMVAGEALAAGVPVLAAAVGGLPEALGGTASGVPGLLVPAEDPDALAAALRRWLADPALRSRLRGAALDRRAALPGWARTGADLRRALAAAAAARNAGEPVPGEPDPARIRAAR